MPLDRDLLHIYIADHRAISTGVAQRLAKMTSYTHLPFACEIEQMHRDTVTEMHWLDAFSSRLDMDGGQVKRGGARLAEMLGRLKLNGRVRSTSPLSPLIEVEMLTAAVTVKITFWHTLAALPDAAGDAEHLSELLDQAHEQFEDITKWHRYLRGRAFQLVP